MKKFFVFAAAAAFALVACDKTGPQVDGSGNGDNEPGAGSATAGVVFNEFDGNNKFIELFNNGDAEVDLVGVYIVKYDKEKDGGKSTTWTGAAGMKIAANGYVVLESSDLSDPAEDGDPNYQYETPGHMFNGGLSAKKNIKYELYNANDELLDTFIRGEERDGWNVHKDYAQDKTSSYSRVPDGVGAWKYANPTPKAANGTAKGDITQQPEM